MTSPKKWMLLHALVLTGAVATLSVCLTAQADTVRVVAANQSGQGWRFLDSDGKCKVVTARHVVVARDGAVLNPQVVDLGGVPTPVGSAPLLSDRETDIAVLSLPSHDAPTLCGDGRLSAIGAERRAKAMAGLVMETFDNRELLTVPVQPSARAVNQGRGDVFAVRPVTPGIRIVSGFSGSPVLDAEGPVGIVTDALEDVGAAVGEGRVVRIDAVRRVMASAASPRSRSTLPIDRPTPTIRVLRGYTPSLGPDANQLVEGGEAGWRVEPAGRAVRFIIAYPRPLVVSLVQLSISMGQDNDVGYLIVSTNASSSDSGWVYKNACKRNSGDLISCRVNPSEVQQLDITLTTLADSSIILRNWTVE